MTLSPEAKQAVKNALTGESSVENLYYAISTMAYTGMKSKDTLRLLIVLYYSGKFGEVFVIWRFSKIAKYSTNIELELFRNVTHCNAYGMVM